ncbi:substrate-binding domain-containing protein [Cupriavidus sp. D39]|nr:substrate-binding domain-containing protein [Cupriavidus sp. D39]MCY0854745.1 substrate-binding domain-containing protein [Cupriavidus sp. D39]
MQALASHGLDSKGAPCEVAAAYTREHGREAASRLLSQNTEVSAIVAANDLIALGVYDALRERGLQCPRDLSVVGHNDMPLVDMVAPSNDHSYQPSGNGAPGG